MEVFPSSPPGRAQMDVVNADITAMAVDAICNSASQSLRGGGGVDGAIRRAAGPELDKACQAVGVCPIGGAVATRGFKLRAGIVVHTAAPRWRTDSDEEWGMLASCYRASLLRADFFGAMSIAFPAIGSGVRGFPVQRAAEIAVETVSTTLGECRSIGRVFFSCPDPIVFGAHSEAVNTAPRLITTAEEWQDDWREVPVLRRCYWIRIYGFLRQHWATVSEVNGKRKIIFFNDYGAMFDEIILSARQAARPMLKKLGFEPWGPGTETADFASLTHARPHRGDQDAIYSSLIRHGHPPLSDW